MAFPLLLAIGAGLLAANTIGTTLAQNRVRKRQNENNRQWVEYQNQKQQDANQAEDQRRQKAYEGLNQYLATAGQAPREQNIAKETDRLYETAGGDEGIQKVASDAIYSGQKWGTQNFKDGLGRRLADATSEARAQLQDLFKSSAYGSTLYGDALQDRLGAGAAAEEVTFQNDARQGNLRTLRGYQQVEPIQLSFRPSPFGQLLGGAGNLALMAGASGMGGASPAGISTAGYNAGGMTAVRPDMAGLVGPI